jgi:hypothetical protein
MPQPGQESGGMQKDDRRPVSGVEEILHDGVAEVE